MNETNESKKETNEYKKQMVKVGYSGQVDSRRPIRFMGKKIGSSTNHTLNGPNQNRFHDWTLFEVPAEPIKVELNENTPTVVDTREVRKYRVLDEYTTQWQGESDHSTLTRVLTVKEVGKYFAVLANEYLDEDDYAEDVDDKPDHKFDGEEVDPYEAERDNIVAED